MTSRSSDRIGRLARRRAALAAEYGKARRRHRGAAKAAGELCRATAALLREEINLFRAAPLKRAQRAREAEAPSLFEERQA